MFRAGAYMKALKLPSLIGYEGVGVIEAVGPAVQGFARAIGSASCRPTESASTVSGRIMPSCPRAA